MIFFNAAIKVIEEFTNGQDIENLDYCGYNELMDTIGEFGSPEMDNFDHDGWCGLKPRNNEPYTAWINGRNPYLITEEIENIFSNAKEIFKRGGNPVNYFDGCVIDSLIKSPLNITKFSGRADLPKILEKLPNPEKYEKIIRAKESIRLT